MPILALLLLLCAAPAAAGVSAYGLQAGLAQARLHGSYGDEIGSDYRSGFAIGAHARFGLTRALAVQPELWWVQKGAKGSATIGATPVDVKHALQYLEIPVLLRVHAPAVPWEPYFVFGPAIAIRTGGDIDVVYGSSPGGAAQTSYRSVRFGQIFEKAGTLDSPSFRDLDWGVVGGSGVVLGQGFLRYPIEVRYTRGFVEVRRGTDSTNGAFIATLGVEVR